MWLVDLSAVCCHYFGHEEGFLAFSSFVQFFQQISSDSCHHEFFHDADVFFSGEKDALVYHLDLDPELVDFSQSDLIQEFVASPLQVS